MSSIAAEDGISIISGSTEQLSDDEIIRVLRSSGKRSGAVRVDVFTYGESLLALAYPEPPRRIRGSRAVRLRRRK